MHGSLSGLQHKGYGQERATACFSGPLPKLLCSGISNMLVALSKAVKLEEEAETTVKAIGPA
jgi:hypothetical protein